MGSTPDPTTGTFNYENEQREQGQEAEPEPEPEPEPEVGISDNYNDHTSTLDKSFPQDRSPDHTQSPQYDHSPHADVENEVDKLPQEVVIRVLKRYTTLSKNEIFRRTGTASRTGRRWLSTMPKRIGKGRTGRPPRIGDEVVQKMIEHVSGPNSERNIGWHELGKEYGIEAHKHTVQHAMEKAGYKKCQACQRGYLRPQDRAERLQFAKSYQTCPQWQWNQASFCVKYGSCPLIQTTAGALQ